MGVGAPRWKRENVDEQNQVRLPPTPHPTQEHLL